MAELKQNPDGSLSIVRESDSFEVMRVGGKIGPAASNTPGYIEGSTLVFNIGGGTDSAGGLLAWQNTTGNDVIVTFPVLDVTTVATTACSASFGSSTNSTGLASNFISAKDVHGATGTFNGGALSVKVVANNFITGSVSSGTSSGLVARAIFQYMQVPAAGNN